MGTFGISKIEPELILQPNKIQTFHTQASLNGDTILSINPHMHLLGKSFWAFALTPGGDTIPLIKINKWDFRWQYYYTFKNPVIIKKERLFMFTERLIIQLKIQIIQIIHQN
jgi:hypothetical protein